MQVSRYQKFHISISVFSKSTLPLALLLATTSASSLSEEFSGDNSSTIEEVWVESSSSAVANDYLKAAKIPGGVTVLDVQELRQKSIQNLADTLRFVPGVWAASANGGQGVFFSSRGSNLDATNFDNNGIKLLQDGLPVTTADGNNHNRIIDPLSAESAIFARGANAYSFGASTLGGAINFTTPTGHDISGAQVRFNAGSHGLTEGRLTFGGVSGDLDGLITLESRAWDGFREHNEERRSGLYANVGWQITDELNTRFFATYLNNDQEIPGSLNLQQIRADSEQASFNAERGNFQLDVDTWRIANRTDWQLNENQRLEFGLSYEQQELFHPIVSVFVPIAGELTNVFSLLIDTDHEDIGGVLRFYQTLGNHELTFGLNYGRNKVDGQHFAHDGARPTELSTLIDNQAETIELYAQGEWQLSSSVQLITGIQVVSADRETLAQSVGDSSIDNPSGDYDAVNPRLGLLWALSDDTTVYGNLSRLYEPPTNFQIEDEDDSGNPDTTALEAMSGTVAEIGARGRWGLAQNASVNWDVSAYYATLDDEILSRQEEGIEGVSLATNFDSTIHAGIEALVVGNIQLSDAISFNPNFSYTLNRFTFDDDPIYGDNDLPAAPSYFFRSELIFKHRAGFYGGPVIDIVGERWADFDNSYKVDSYALLGLRAGFEASKWRTFLDVQNLLDEDFISSHGVRDRADETDTILNPGVPLSVYLGFEYQL